MKKLFSVIAMILISVMAFSACESTAVELLSFIDEAAGSADYEGYDFTIYFESAQYDPAETIFVYDKNTLQGEALLKRIDDIEKEINVNIGFNTQYTHITYQTAAMSGNVNADAITFGYMNAMLVMANGGFLHPITDFPEYIDLSDTDKYGTAPVLEAAMIDSVPYAVQPCYWPGYQSLDCYILTYNKDLTIPNGIPDFHEFWENETWTWETYEKEFLERAKVERSDGYLYAMSMVPIQYFSSLFYSNDVQLVRKNAAGENVVNPYPDEFVHAYETGLHWATTYKDTICFESGVASIDNFMNEMSMVGLAFASQVTTGAVAYDAKFNYGLMPFPCGPDATYGIWGQYMDRISGLGIAKTSEEPAIAAHTLSLLYEPFEEFGGENGLYDYYNTNIFLTETDTEIFFKLMENVRYDYTFWERSDVGRQVHSDFGTAIKQGIGVSEAMQRHRNTIEEMAYDFVLPNYDYMYENYYSKLEQN